MTDTADAVAEVTKIQPNLSNALSAIHLAAEFLVHARQLLNEQKYEETYQESKDVIRMASAGLMYYEGCITSTLGATSEYLKNKHPELPVDEWVKIETTFTEQSPGLSGYVMRFIKKAKKSMKKMRSVLLI